MKKSKELILPWSEPGATLSDKSARTEYGITQNEIHAGMKNGSLHFKVNYVFDNPYLKLIRKEVECLVRNKFGKNYVKVMKLKHDLTQTNRELNKTKRQLNLLEKKKNEIQSILKKIEG